LAEINHIPVLLKASIDPILANAGKIYMDCTFGGGGHTSYLLGGRNVERVYAVDKDPTAHERANARFPKEISDGRLVMIEGDYGDVKELVRQHKIPPLDGIALDAGVSSFQFDNPERGFSFSKSGPLDMRMDLNQTLTAAEIVNQWNSQDLAKIFFEYGEEPLGRKIAQRIVNRRMEGEIKTTGELAKLIYDVYGHRAKGRGIHPATKAFQALRIAVNDELKSLERFLEAIPELLAPHGVVSVISFHSLEDRLVKNRFKILSAACICPPEIMTCPRCNNPPAENLTKKPVVPSEEEIENNPRARSAKLRILRRNG
jgi:16S rRNA (cytosine1402-N4)-methyltransferase